MFSNVFGIEKFCDIHTVPPISHFTADVVDLPGQGLLQVALHTDSQAVSLHTVLHVLAQRLQSLVNTPQGLAVVLQIQIVAIAVVFQVQTRSQLIAVSPGVHVAGVRAFIVVK